MSTFLLVWWCRLQATLVLLSPCSWYCTVQWCLAKCGLMRHKGMKHDSNLITNQYQWNIVEEKFKE